MRVLITRPRPDAEAFAKSLHALGHTTLIEPLIDIAFEAGPPLDLRGVQALLFTSANGVRAAARRTTERTIRVLAVGPATAAEAAAQGFTRVAESSGKGVDALAQTARATLKPADGALVHATGSVSAGDLKAALAPSGFAVRTEQLYQARAARRLTSALIAELAAGRIDVATFFSPRTARVFAELLAPHASSCASIVALALSPAVAAALAPVRFRKTLVAAQPNAASLLDLLKSA